MTKKKKTNLGYQLTTIITKLMSLLLLILILILIINYKNENIMGIIIVK
jgi:hypothetical protein